MTNKITVCIGDLDTPIIVEYCFTRGRPGNRWGPPEDCYEGDPSVIEIQSVKYLSGRPADKQWAKLTESELESIESDIFEEENKEEVDDRGYHERYPEYD